MFIESPGRCRSSGAEHFHYRTIARRRLGPPERQVEQVVVGLVEQLVEAPAQLPVEPVEAARQEALEHEVELEQRAAAAPAYAGVFRHRVGPRSLDGALDQQVLD